MTNITIEIPEEVGYLKKIPSDVWASIVREIVQKKLQEIAEIKRISMKSKATDADVEEITNEIKEAVLKHYKK